MGAIVLLCCQSCGKSFQHSTSRYWKDIKEFLGKSKWWKQIQTAQVVQWKQLFQDALPTTIISTVINWSNWKDVSHDQNDWKIYNNILECSLHLLKGYCCKNPANERDMQYK